MELITTVTKLENNITSVKQQLSILVEKVKEADGRAAKVEERAAKVEETVAKAKKMNVVYDSAHSVECILCSQLKVNNQDFSMTITQALRSSAADWNTVQAALKLEDKSSECLLKTFNKIKDKWLEYGHTSKPTAKSPFLSTGPIPIAEEYFTLCPREVDILQKLLAWILPDLPTSAMLANLKEAT
ncbi:hypothetical protein PtA15_7A668 [Puccinia triticina]|uniref:Uncharacterized protein n=1 Tax=Puccinia triticina TaxID=208348 RepID=A0ABY7CNV3_9BASI|nr:uncharacterized protein PtA15_7A668 [Puccinia triticina]WAQ86939.1 hypothetical protein PtA15_7A668 [Puccinia triticina]